MEVGAMRRLLTAVVSLSCACTYDPPTRTAEWYDNPVTYRDDRETHPRRAEFQRYLDAAVRDGLPGAALLIRTPGDGTWAGAAGYADLANDVPWRPSMIGRVGSITKTFAAAVLLRTLEARGVPLEERAAPSLSKELNREIDNAKDATFGQLLNHTSGIYDYLSDTSLFLEAAGSYEFEYHTKEQFLEYAYGKSAEYGAGDGWNYSETNYLLLEVAAEHLTGQASTELMDHQVISELGLRSTFYAPSEELPRGLVRGYADLFADERLIDVTDTNLERFHYDGGVISNVYDLADFLDALLTSDYLSEAARSALVEVVSTRGNSKRGTDYYGHGVILEDHPIYGRIFGHSGTSLGFSAHVYHLEDSGITFAAIVNASQKTLEERSYDWFSPLTKDSILELVTGEATTL
jgi:D-alanyl-D-alanine carboxypeptidase